MDYIDLLDELSTAKRFRNITIGGYVTRFIPKPPVFTTETLAKGCFAEFKILYVLLRGRRTLSTGRVAVYLPEGTLIRDFYELKGNLTLAKLDYTRLVTMMSFTKLEEPNKKETWRVSPVKVDDLEITKLSPSLQNDLMDFVKQPLAYKHDGLKHVLEPVAEVVDTSKIEFDFKGLGVADYYWNYDYPNTEEFEQANNYLIDPEYDIIKEALKYRHLSLNIDDFGFDKKLLGYISWLTEDNILYINSIEEIKRDKHCIVLTSKDNTDLPYLRLKRGVLTRWET